MTERLKYIRGRLRRKLPGLGSVLALLLAVATLLPSARAAGENGAILMATLPNKPEITIQGNVVVDEGGAPTGFYELALCVRSPRRIFGPDPANPGSSKELTEAEYATVLAAIEAGTAAVTEDNYTITYYPFSAASAVVNVNTDVLTAVHWDIQEVKYAAWDATTSTYAAGDAVYPRGVDVAASADPEQWGATDPDPFPDVTAATMNKLGRNPVALDAEGDRSTFTAAAQADYYYTEGNTKAAVVTLSAHAPDNKPVVYKTSTPVAVVRFSYDLKRFPKGIVKTNDVYNTNNPLNQITGSSDFSAGAAEGFWLGLSRDNVNPLFANGKTPLTWLADTAMDGAGAPLSFSDALAAQTENGQVVWTRLSSKDTGATPDFKQTEYYYYLGAQATGSNGTPGKVKVYTAADTFVEADHVKIPTTQGTKVLGSGTEENPEPAAGDPSWTATTPYSFYSNILYLNEGVKLRLVNDLTFKKPTGGTGGNQILFYDWDDTLIGTLVVGDGDVRAQVNSYIERTMVHPDLRVGDILKDDLGGNVPDYSAGAPAAGSPSEKYKNVLDSLDREYTYRGKYPYQLGGSVTQDDPNDLPGSEYPLTNKLDYAFYRHINTVTTQEYTDTATGATITDRYITADALSSNQDAAQYPWVYGWAVVEDTGTYNNREWQVRRDAAKREDTWTTFGVGELSNLNPSFDLSTPGAQAIPALPGTPVTGTGTTTTYPAFIDPTAATAPTDYSYKLSSAGDARYLRFADFSDIGSEYRDGQDTLVVKAVYEPGTELLEGYNYQMVQEPSYSKLNEKAALEGGAYSATITLERASCELADGYVRGVNRVREPAVRQDNTYDQKWIANELLGVDHDLDNASIEIAKNLSETLFTKVDTDNGEEIQFTLPLSARHNKVNYFLTNTYGSNFVSGGTRSDSNYNKTSTAHTIDNYNYDSEDRVTADSYYDKQDYYYQVTTYEDRDGSHGFVLYGTLNYLMEKATRVVEGTNEMADFQEVSGYLVLRDANLRQNAQGTLADSGLVELEMQDKIIAAAQACQAHKGDPDFWDNDLDCAQLSYHQLQWFIIDGSLRNRAAADAATLPFCHLHKACAALVSDKPKDWPDLIDKAANDPDTIEQLRTDEIEAMTHLRKDINGNAFTSSKEFKTAVADAVAAGCTSWDDIQYHIIHKSAPADDTEARTKYWWYDGTASFAAARPGTWDAFLAAAQGVDDPVALPDGTSRPSTAKIVLTESIFNTNLGLDENKVSGGWKNLTHNLVPSHTENEEEGTGTTTRFTDFESWLDLIIEAVKAMPSDIPAGQEWAWIQYYILHHGDPNWTATYPFGADGVTDETVNYWWKDGGTRLVVNSVRTLLKAAAAAQSADPAEAAMGQAALDRVNWKLWDSFYLKKANGETNGVKQWADFRPAGVQDTDPVTADVMQLVKDAITADPDMLTWEPLQYYLIHAAAGTTDQIDGESPYYWWKDGGLGKELDFPAAFSTANAKNTAGILIEAALWHRYGSPVAFNKLTDDVFAQTHLIQGIANSPAFEQTDLTKFADKAAFLTKLYEFLDKGQATLGLEEYGFFAPEWFQMQYAFLNGGTYLPISDPAIIATVTDYWWYDKENNKPPTPTKPEEPSDKLMGYMEQFLNDGLTEAQLKGKVTDKKMNGKNTADPTENFFIYRTNAGATWTAFNIATAKTRIANLAKLIKGDPTKYADYYKDGKLTLYWAQIQVYVVEQKLESNADALDKIVNTWGWKKVADGGKIPDAIDLSVIPGGASLVDEMPLEAEPTPEVQAEPEPETPVDNAYNERLEIPLGEEAQAAIANDLPRKIVTYRSLVPRKTT